MSTNYVVPNVPAPFTSGAYAAIPRSSSLTPLAATPVPVASALQGGAVGIAYSESITTEGGVSPYTYAVVSGTLPTALTLNSATGVISGTPTTAGTFTFTIGVTDANASTGQTNFSIVVATSGGAGGNYGFVS